MDEVKGSKFEPDFNQSVKIEFSDHRISSNAGVLLLREADSKLAIISSIADQMIDTRDQSSIRYQLDDLMRERVYAMAMGYSAQDDVDRLAHDPAFRIAVWNRSGDRVIDERLASQPTQSRLLAMMAAHRSNVNALRDGLFQSVHRHIAAAGNGKRVRHATIDLDSFPIQVHGKQQGSDYNGHYCHTAYHPLVASISVAGNYDGTRDGNRIGNGFIHAILPHNETKRSESERSAEQLLEHYRARGTFEDRLGEFNQAIGAHLSSPSFSENECTMLMALLAFNLASIVRNEHEDVQGGCMDLGRLQSQVLKTGALIVKHSRRLIVRVARSVQGFWEALNRRFSHFKLPEKLRANTRPNRSNLRPPPAHAHRTEVLRA